MINKKYLFLFLAFVMSMAAACGGTESGNSTGNANSNSNANAAHPPMGTARNDGPTLNDAPTFRPVVQQYWKALETKNDAMLRDTLTAEFQKSLEEDMKAENRKDFAGFVAELDYRPGQGLEVRNEKIEGNKGVAEIRGGAYKNWTPFSFALENGKWRFTGGSPEIDNMPPSNANSAK
jgi:hypothetical protein